MLYEYYKERAKWKKFGKPTRTQDQMHELFSVCNLCDKYKKHTETTGECGVCGCGIKKDSKWFNKIYWSTTRCPLEDPKWLETESRFAKDVIITDEDLKLAEKEHAIETEQENTPKKKPCNCRKS